MNKIRNLFKNVFKKKKKNQDLEDVFFEEDDLTENTVILPKEAQDYDLAPAHPNQSENKIPTSDNLDYPLEEGDSADIEDTFDDTLIISTGVPEEQDSPEKTTAVISANEEILDNDLLAEVDLESQEDEEVEFNINTTDETDHEDLAAHDQQDDSQEEQEFDSEDDDEDEDEYDEDEDSDFTNEIDLEEGSLTLKDRIEHIGTRVTDRFRSINKRDLNEVYKSKAKPQFTQNIDLSALKSKASSIDWKSIPNKFFKDEQLPKYHRYFQITGILTTLTVVATLMGTFIAGSRKYSDYGRSADIALNDSGEVTRQDLDKIADSNLFKTEKVQVKDNTPTKIVDQSNVPCTQAGTKSSLNIKLVDTIVLQDSVKSIASVQMNSKKDLIIGREGDVLNNDLRIGKIEKTRLIFRNLGNQNCEYIEQPQKRNKTRRSRPPKIMSKSQVSQFKREKMPIDGISQEGNNYKIKRQFLKSKLADINTILTQAKGLMIKNPDGTMSFKIVDVDPEGVFAYLGVEDGDVINNINGEPIRDLNEVMNLFGKITSLNNLSLGFVRNGESVTKSYSIE